MFLIVPQINSNTGGDAVHDTPGPTTQDNKEEPNVFFSVQTPGVSGLNNTQQTTNSLIARTVHGNELRLFWAKAFPITLTIDVAHLT